MKSLRILFLVLLYTFAIGAEHSQSSPLQTYVYVCDSPDATKYHLSSTCRGLNACKHKIIKVTKEDAIKQGKKTLCGWED